MPLSRENAEKHPLKGQNQLFGKKSFFGVPRRQARYTAALGTDCRVAARREASALGVLLAMTGCVGRRLRQQKASPGGACFRYSEPLVQLRYQRGDGIIPAVGQVMHAGVFSTSGMALAGA